MNENKNCVPPFANRTKWERENKGERKGFLVRTAEEKEARRALKDFQRDYMWEHMDDKEPNND